MSKTAGDLIKYKSKWCRKRLGKPEMYKVAVCVRVYSIRPTFILRHESHVSQEDVKVTM